MKENVNFSTFCDRFQQLDRGSNFSYDGKKALFDYLEELEEDSGKTIDFDCIALCCEYNEYEDLEAFHKEYNKEDYPDLETLRNHTQVIEFGNDSFIIQGF